MAAWPPPMRDRLLRRWLVAGFITCLLPLSAPLAQDAPRKSEIRGIVLRAEDRAPVINARVSLEGTGHLVLTDRHGRFKFPKVAAGEYLVRAEIAGHPPSTSQVRVERDDRLQMEFLVGVPAAGHVLPEVEVSAPQPASGPFAEFNRRAMEGGGRYFTRADIEKRRPATLMDLLRTVPGARISCPRNIHGCVLRLRRSTCNPAYYLDGLPTDPSVLFLTVPNDVEGLEVYTGPSELPIELGGSKSGCGVIAIWTRHGQRPARTP